ncbi:hypothetical protein MPLSOD_80299 [Mesorhizobium sp. SOD10]|nr:hypothetical protein MPLSOD_80299 [Mesorhizobium sp. SOD10]
MAPDVALISVAVELKAGETTDIVGSPVEVQEARSTEKSAAAMLRLSPRARRQPADFKINSPSASGRFVIAAPLQHRAAITLLFPTGTGSVSNLQASELNFVGR